MALEKELETFKRELPNLLAQEGKYVVVSGDDIVGVFAAYEDALTVGYEKCGLKPFLVKKIQAICRGAFKIALLCAIKIALIIYD
jgi:hypothetical protein